MYDFLRVIQIEVQNCGRPNLLAKRVQSIMQEMTKKYEALLSSQSSLPTNEVTLAKANQELESSRKRVADLEMSLNEAWEGRKRLEDGIWKMHNENLKLFKVL